MTRADPGPGERGEADLPDRPLEPCADLRRARALAAKSLPGEAADDYRNIFENAAEGIYRSSLGGVQLRANPALVRLNGYDGEAEMLAAVNDIAREWYVDPGRRAEFTRLLYTHGRVTDFESEIYRHKTRERIWVSESAWLVCDDRGEPLYYEGTVQDITERQRVARFRSGLIRFVSETLGRGLDEGFYGRLLELATEVIPGADAGSLLVADAAERYRFVAAQGFDLEALREVSFAADELILDEEQRPLLTTDAYAYGADSLGPERAAVLRAAGRLGDIQASLSIPVMLKGRLAALLNLNSFRSVSAFSAESGEFAEAFAVQIGALLERFNLERELLELAEFRRGLVDFVDESLGRGLDGSFYQRLLERAVAVIPGAEAGSLLLQDADGLYAFAAAVNFDLGELSKVRFAWNELEYDFGNLRPQLFYHYEVNRQIDPERLEILERYGRVHELKVSLSIPVSLDDEVLAFFHLDNFRTPHAFDRGGTDMAEAFAKHVAVIFKRLSLEAELRARQEALEASNQELERLANYDLVTGLPNRALFRDRLVQATLASSRDGRKLALLFIDLDGFKDVNDTLGHSAGDLLLREVAGRLAGAVRAHDTVSRLGGDEFTVVLSELADAGDVAVLAARVLASFAKPFAIEGRELTVSASIGIALFPDDADDAETLLKHADTAMYRAKAAGKNSYCFFTAAMNARASERLATLSALRGALGRGEFTLHYQPRVELGSGRVSSVEALVRWQHPELGLVAPGLFIPLAEESGLIHPLGKEVLRQACLQAKAWQRAGLARRVAVNLSVRQLEESDLVKMVAEALKEAALPAELLELEITESAVMTRVETNIVTLGALREMGVHIAVDDFGTAYSSLSHLTRLPLDSLKIDRAFLAGVGEGEAAPGAAVVQAIMALARSFGLRVVAEGVETGAQLRFLQALGCDEAQGYLFARPLPPADLTASLARGYPVNDPVNDPVYDRANDPANDPANCLGDYLGDALAPEAKT